MLMDWDMKVKEMPFFNNENTREYCIDPGNPFYHVNGEKNGKTNWGDTSFFLMVPQQAKGLQFYSQKNLNIKS